MRASLPALVLTAATLVASSTTPAAGAAEALTDSEAVNRYAPAVYLHPDEKYLPYPASTFVRASKLIWHHDSSCGDDDIDWYPDPTRMATGGYTHRKKQHPFRGCDHEGREYASNELVRPRDDRNVAGGEGMFLDVADSQHGGEGTGTPVYYDVRGAAGSKVIVYWFSYAYSWSKITGEDRTGGRPDGGHDGDWESIAVSLGKGNRAWSVYYAQHDEGCAMPLDPRDRPNVFTANGSHASYPAPGHYEHPTKYRSVIQDEARGDGALWDARSRLRRLDSEPWYGKEAGHGYGGGWGEVGNIAASTGPLGPHRIYKTGEPGPNPPQCKGPVRPIDE